MSESAPSVPPVPRVKSRPVVLLERTLILAVLAALGWYITARGRELWNEWWVLRTEMDRVRTGVAIGYPGINPRYSYATRPAVWVIDEGDETSLWGGWKHGVGHQWFKTGRGEVRPTLLSYPVGRDVIQAIDEPVVERNGGARWSLIPDEDLVVGHRLGGVDTAYPLLVLNKVFVVNDTIRDQPYLVANNPYRSPEEQVAVYETVVNGRRVTMGLTGYFYDGEPLLYDRGTESLWVAKSGALRAIAGKHKGRQLRRLARPSQVAWGDWRSAHPDSRLVVGADRSRPLPEL